MLGEAFVDDAHFSDADPDTVDLLQRLLGATQVISVQVDALPTDRHDPENPRWHAARETCKVVAAGHGLRSTRPPAEDALASRDNGGDF